MVVLVRLLSLHFTFAIFFLSNTKVFLLKTIGFKLLKVLAICFSQESTKGRLGSTLIWKGNLVWGEGALLFNPSHLGMKCLMIIDKYMSVSIFFFYSIIRV